VRLPVKWREYFQCRCKTPSHASFQVKVGPLLQALRFQELVLRPQLRQPSSSSASIVQQRAHYFPGSGIVAGRKYRNVAAFSQYFPREHVKLQHPFHFIPLKSTDCFSEAEAGKSRARRPYPEFAPIKLMSLRSYWVLTSLRSTLRGRMFPAPAQGEDRVLYCAGRRARRCRNTGHNNYVSPLEKGAGGGVAQFYRSRSLWTSLFIYIGVVCRDISFRWL
jgi:hypothetical protein